MIRQQPGDLLEIHFEDHYYYLVVLTKIAMFGGNIVFAFHGDGSRKSPDELLPTDSGLNICTDLLLPKKEGKVLRLKVAEDTAAYWRTRLAKGTNEYRIGHKADEWYIYNIDDLMNHVDRTKIMTQKYREAMDLSLYSFDLTAEKILAGYTPNQNPHLKDE